MTTDNQHRKILPYEITFKSEVESCKNARNYKKVTIINVCVSSLNAKNSSVDSDTSELINNILTQHYIEKAIATNIDFVGVGGLPLRNRSNPIDATLAALQIKNIFEELSTNRKKENLPNCNFSIGIYTGSMVAEISDKNKLCYQICGEPTKKAYELATKTQSSNIIISEQTQQEIAEYFDCKQIKDNETIRVFEVLKIKEKYADGDKEIYPNKDFLNKLSKI